MNTYQSPLSSRYCSAEMSFLFSPQYKISTWRKLWVALASEQRKLGLPITQAQIDALQSQIHDIDFEAAKEHEMRTHHDVMAHIHTFGDKCPEAKGIIHLGATSCFVTDNTDIIQMKEALSLLLHKIVQIIRNLSEFAHRTASIPTLSYTHFQTAQPTTVGKRACLWLQDLLIDLNDFQYVLKTLQFLGLKGATGTQASFLSLFNGNHQQVIELEQGVAHAMGFTQLFPISGQTYTRKQDIKIAATLASFAASSHKFATDLRLLAHLKEIEEPFTTTQVGSSAMPHKRNPIYAERICGLSRFLISLQDNALYTEATQWLERSLDDSSNRKLYLPEAFLTADAICSLMLHLSANLVINPHVIAHNLEQELPFLSIETQLMELVKQGKDRQQMHEQLKKEAHLASQAVKTGQSPQLSFPLSAPSTLIGRAPEQTLEFLQEHIQPALKPFSYLAPLSTPVPL